MVIYSVKCFGDINRTNVSCSLTFDYVNNNKSSCTDGKATSTSFLKTKLAVRCKEKGFKFINDAVFKNL